MLSFFAHAGSIIGQHLLNFLADGNIQFLVITAYIMHAPDAFPTSWKETPQWCWGWFIAGAKAYIGAKTAVQQPSIVAAVQPE